MIDDFGGSLGQEDKSDRVFVFVKRGSPPLSGYNSRLRPSRNRLLNFSNYIIDAEPESVFEILESPTWFFGDVGLSK